MSNPFHMALKDHSTTAVIFLLTLHLCILLTFILSHYEKALMYLITK
jgi:hypothetical protein